MSDRTLTIMAVLFVSVVLGILLYRGYLDDQPVREKQADEIQSPEPKRLTSVIAKSTSCSRAGGGRTQIQGYVENTGNVTLATMAAREAPSNDARGGEAGDQGQ